MARAALLALALGAAAAVAQVVPDTDFCGDTGISVGKYYLDAVKGEGTATINAADGASSTGKVAVSATENGGTIVLTTSAGSVVLGKRVECIYNVEIRYASSSLWVRTGAPGLRNQTASQNCYEFRSTGDSSATFIKNPPGSPCPVAGEASTISSAATTGSISGLDKSKKADPTCPLAAGDTAPVKPAYYSAGKPDATGTALFIGPTYMSFGRVIPGAASMLIVGCAVSSTDPTVTTTAADGTTISGAVTIRGETASDTLCFTTRTFAGPSLFAWMDAAATCPTFAEGTASMVSATLLNPPAGVPPAPTPAPSGPTKPAEVPIVKFSAPLSVPSNLNIRKLVDPCTAWALREKLSGGLGVASGALAITSAGIGSNVITFALDAPINTLTAKPAGCAGRRQLREAEEGGAARQL